MLEIRDRNDLAALPEPRYFYTAPRWLRRFSVVLLASAGLFGSALVIHAFQAGNVLLGVGGSAAVALCAGILLWGRPTDWRTWLSLAATRDGLYLVVRRRRVVCVPWNDVVALSVERIPTHNGTKSFPRLTLRLPEESWALFDGLSHIKGSGPERQYVLSLLGEPGEKIIAELEAFRSGRR